MKLIYSHENPALVGLARNLLEDAGIAVSVKNEFSAAGMAPPYNINQELWLLDDDDFEKARDLLSAFSEQEDPK